MDRLSQHYGAKRNSTLYYYLLLNNTVDMRSLVALMSYLDLHQKVDESPQNLTLLRSLYLFMRKEIAVTTAIIIGMYGLISCALQ